MVVTHVFAVAGAKGGVGKTTTAINLGTAFAERGWSVLVVETDLAMANVVDFLDLDVDTDTDPTLHDVLRGAEPVREAIYEAPGGIRVLPSGVDLEGFAAANVTRLDDVLDTIQSAYEIVLLDTGAGLSQETLYPLGLADETILVSTPRVASVRDTTKTRELVERVGGDVAGAVITKTGRGGAPPAERIADFLEVGLLGQVPEDGAVPASQDAGRPVVEHADEAPAAEAYAEIAAHLEASMVDDADSIPAGHDQEDAERAAIGAVASPDGSGGDAFEFDDGSTAETEIATVLSGEKGTTLEESTGSAVADAELEFGERRDEAESETVSEFWNPADGHDGGTDESVETPGLEFAELDREIDAGRPEGMPEPPSPSDPIGRDTSGSTDDERTTSADGGSATSTTAATPISRLRTLLTGLLSTGRT